MRRGLTWFMVWLALFSMSSASIGCSKGTNSDAQADPSTNDQATPGSETESTESYVPVEVESNWYAVTYVEPKTYVIREPQSSQGNVSYLILGDKRAVMFDTGSGENFPVNGSKMTHIIDQITDLPVTLLLSHFHFDHNQNLGEFDHVAFIELQYLVDGTSEDGVYTFSQNEILEGDYPQSVEIDEWWPEGADIDLGGRSIQVVGIPGHTDESAMIVDHANKLMFMGDYLYNGELFVFGEHNLSVYEQTLDGLIANYDSSYALYGAHGYPVVPHTDLQDLKGLLECISTGACVPKKTSFWGYEVHVFFFNGMTLCLFI